MMVENKASQIYAFIFPVVGPVFCCTAFFIAYNKTFTADLGIFFLLSSFLLFRERKQGFALSLLILSLISVVRLFLTKDIFWELGLDCSLLIALYLTYEGISFAERFIKTLKQDREDAFKKLDEISSLRKEEQEHFLSLQEKYQDQVASYNDQLERQKEKIESLDRLCLTLSETIDLSQAHFSQLEGGKKEAEKARKIAEKKIEYLEKKLSQYDHAKQWEDDLQKLVQEKQILQRELQEQESLKERYFLQYAAIKQREENLSSALMELQRDNSKVVLEREEEARFWKAKAKSLDERKIEKLREEEQIGLAHLQNENREWKEKYSRTRKLLEQYTKQVKELLHMRASYQQLQKQFKEKNLLLHRTRKELFSLELERELERREAFEKELQESVSLPYDFEKENESLLQLVDSLLPKVELKAFQQELF